MPQASRCMPNLIGTSLLGLCFAFEVLSLNKGEGDLYMKNDRMRGGLISMRGVHVGILVMGSICFFLIFTCLFNVRYV